MRESRSTAELMAAYVDGVTELTAEERKRVEARLAEDPVLRDEESATRDMLGLLRELPPAGTEPDWNALERSISDAVGVDVPKLAWWRRWRWVVPGAALAAAAVVLLLVMRREPESVIPPVVHAPSVVAPDESRDEPVAVVYLDGSEIEVELEAADLIDDPLDGLDAEGELVDSDAFLAPDDLAWVDDLDDESLKRIEGWLENPTRRRKKS